MEKQDLKALYEEIEKLDTFINDINLECEKMSKDILKKLCLRAIKSMNQSEAILAASTDEYPKDFKFFDILCVELETKTYDEISPFLHEYVERCLTDEYDLLPMMERFILDHSECWALMDHDDSVIKEKLFNAFNEERFAHLNLKKIENYMLKK